MPLQGALILLAALPYLVFQIVCSTSWQALDVRVFGCVARLKRFSGLGFWDRFVRHPGDGFIFPTLLWLLLIPALCVHEALHAQEHGFVLWRALLFNVLRIGPMYTNFAHSYTLAHKESHAYGAVFTDRLNALGLARVFNWVTGPFFGIVPGTFTHSHQLNHHRYHNSASDVYSTGGYPRDSLVSFCRYLPIWFLYASNASTLVHFTGQGNLKAAGEVALATLYYLGLVGGLVYLSPAWAACSIVWAFVEGNILLCMVNWVWHCQCDEGGTPEVVSTTIVRGQEFIFSEEYHAVHHALPGLHWGRYQEEYAKGKETGKYKDAILFQDCNLFVVWGCIVFQDYPALLKLVHDPEGAWKGRGKELEGLLKQRLRHTTWLMRSHSTLLIFILDDFFSPFTACEDRTRCRAGRRPGDSPDHRGGPQETNLNLEEVTHGNISSPPFTSKTAAVAVAAAAASFKFTMALAMNNSTTREVSHTFFGRSFTISQDPSAPNHGMVLWDASVCFLRWLEANPKEALSLKGSRVLEVGAGTGLLGIVLAHALSCKVSMTDLPSVVPNLESNCAQNPLQQGSEGKVSVSAYDWTAPLPEGLVGAPVDYIIGTDVGYSERLNPLLLSSAAEVVRVCEERHGKCPTVIFVNELRCEIAQGVFDVEAPKHFKVQRVRDSKLHPSYQGQNMILLKLTKKKVGGGGGGPGEKAEED